MKNNIIRTVKMVAFYSFLGLILQGMLVSFLFASPAEGQNLRDIKVTVKAVDVTLEQALQMIEQKTQFKFFYVKEEIPLNEKATVNVDEESLYNILEVFAKDYGLTFNRINDQIVVKKNLGQTENLVTANETGNVKGKVTDANTKEPLYGASVILQGTTRGAYTDALGNFVIDNIKPGTYTVAASYVGYSTSTKKVTVNADQTVTVNIALGQTAINLDEVTVTGSLSDRSVRESATTVNLITAKELENRNLDKLINVIAELPGVLAPAGTRQNYQNSKVMNVTNNNINFRGLASYSSWTNNSVKYILDGVELINQYSISNLDPNSIEKIEVAEGPMASTLYGAGSASAIVQIFTKKGIGGLKANFKTTLISQESKAQASNPLNTEYAFGLRNSDGKSYYNLSLNYERQPVSRWALNAGQDEINWSVSGNAGTTISDLKLDLSYQYSHGIAGNYNWDQIYYIALNEGWPNATRLPGYYSDPSKFYATIYTVDNQTVALNLSQALGDNFYHKLSAGLSSRNNPYWVTALGTTTSYYRNDNNQSARNMTYFLNFNKNLSDDITINSTAGINYTAQLIDIITESGLAKQALANSQQLAGNNSTFTNFTQNNIGVFGEVVLKYMNKLFLTLGYRTENNDSYGNGWYPMPRVGLSYIIENVGDFTAKLRGSWGKSTQALPISYKIGYVIASLYATLPNPDLQPQDQYGYEAGADIYYTNNFSFGFTYYNQTIHNYAVNTSVTPIPPPYVYASRYVNVGEVYNKGVELKFKAIAAPFTLEVNATIVSSKYGPGITTSQSSYLAEGKRCIGVPANTINARLTYDIPALLPWSSKGGSLSLTYRESGSEVFIDFYNLYKTLAITGQYTPTNYTEQNGYFVLGLQFNYNVLNNVNIFCDVQNLLNNQDLVPGYYGYMIGRNIAFGFNVSY